MRKLKFSDFARLRVLVVDDNPQFHRVFNAILRGVGVDDIRVALSVEAALREICDVRPDIVFLDWCMEPLNGLDLVRLIRNAESGPDAVIPIVMLTGYAEAHRVKAARDAGVTEFLVKPVSMQSVAARIDEILYRPRAFIRAPTFVGPDRRRRICDHASVERRAAKELHPSPAQTVNPDDGSISVCSTL
jgi:two-component system chemotaxis response regulator CheY